MTPNQNQNSTPCPSGNDALAKYDGPDRVISSLEMRRLLEQQGKRTANYRTGISGLDAAVDGIQTGELIAIGGPRKNGKTLLAQTITYELVRAGVDVLWLSYEVGMSQFLDSMPAGIKFYVPSRLQSADLKWLEDRIRESKIKYKTSVVIIDNLHFLLDLATARNVSLDIGQIIRKLKRMAIEHDMIIFILCHSRKMETDKDGKPKEVSDWDMRDSSFIPQESDTTWMVQRYSDDKGNNLAMLKVCCHRRTGAMDQKVTLKKIGKLLVEWHDDKDSQEASCPKDRSNTSHKPKETTDEEDKHPLALF